MKTILLMTGGLEKTTCHSGGARVCDPQRQRQPAALEIIRRPTTNRACCGSQSRAPVAGAIPRGNLKMKLGRWAHSRTGTAGFQPASSPPVSNTSAGSRRSQWWLGLLLLTAALAASAQTNSLTALLQQGLFEEQASRNLDAAIADYSTLAAQFDKDRQLAATAVFRLGECYRAQGKTNEAAAHYQRILRDFSDQTVLATLSRQNLAGMGAGKTETAATAAAVENSDAQLLKRLEGKPQAELEKILPTLLPDATLENLLQQRNDVQAKRTTLLIDFATNNLNVVRMDSTLETLNTQITEKISGMMQGLKLRSEISGSTANTAAKKPPVAAKASDDEEKEIAYIQQMIQNSPDLINGSPVQGSPLSRAASGGRLRVAEFLLDNGADVNSPSDTAGGRPLLTAANVGHKAMVELLLKHSAEVNAVNGEGNAALHLAVEQGFTGVIEVLLAAKADVNLVNKDMETPLLIAVRKGSRAIATLLLARGADVNAVKILKPNYSANSIEQGRAMFGTALHLAAARGDAPMVALLLTNRADVKAVSLYAETPLQAAAASGKAEVVALLLDAGADAEARINSDSGTALHLATDAGYREVVKTLLTHGANPNVTALDGDPGMTPLMLTANKGNDEGIALLLLQHKADPNLKNGRGYTALTKAIVSGKNAVAKALLTHGANPELAPADYTPLLMAAGRKNKEVTIALLAAKADVNAVGANERRESSLHYAAANGDDEFVQLLLAAGADVNLQNGNGETPLFQAVQFGRDSTVSLLLAAKADPNLRNNFGITPLNLVKDGKSQARPGGMPVAARPLRLPGGAVTINQSQAQTNPPISIADLLRQHGALDVLPDFTRIRITRQGVAQPFEVFSAGKSLTNRFTLLETVMSFYTLPRGYSSGRNHEAAWNEFPFPDFGRVIIWRPSMKIGGKETEIKVSLLNRSNVVDCALDVPVQFGDVIEIPEAVHALNASTPNPVQEMDEVFRFIRPGQTVDLTQPIRNQAQEKEFFTKIERYTALAKNWACLQKSVQLVVAGETTTFKVNSWREGFLSQALGKTEARSALRSSSDLSRVKVTRKTSASAKPEVFTVDVSDKAQSETILWLQDGDVIEVPEKL